MKIAVLASSYPRFPGDGTAPFVMSISKSFVDLGHEVHVVAPYDPEIKPMNNWGIHVHRFHYIWPERLHIMGHARALRADVKLDPLAYLLIPFYVCAAFFRLLMVAFHQECEIIHVHWVLPNGPIAALVSSCLRIPFIVSLHGSDIYMAKKNILFRLLAAYVFHRAAGVSACSKELRQSAIDLGASEDTLLLAWGADPDIFSPQFKNQDKLKSLGITPGELLITGVGRFVHKKGFDVLLKALDRVVKEHPKVHVLLGGDGPLLDELVHQSQSLNLSEKVVFAGRIPWDQVPEFLSTADIFVLPSIRDEHGNVDGLPTVLLEAMSSGVAVIASDIGGVDLVIDQDKTGIMVPPGDINALSDAILNLIDHPNIRTALANQARTSVEKEFNWRNVASTLIALFERSIWLSKQSFRLGTIYRQEVLNLLQEAPEGGKVLDVGCFDGYWLNSIQSPIRIGVDQNPKPGVPGVTLVKANGIQLPFKESHFDTVFALDVIEHIEDDQSFANALSNMLAPGGKLVLTTPSIHIRLFPPFLTQWISYKWGHHLRLGYSTQRLIELFDPALQVNLISWDAPKYRTFYLPMRFLSYVAPGLAARMVRRFAQWDSQNPKGDNGFYILEGILAVE